MKTRKKNLRNPETRASKQPEEHKAPSHKILQIETKENAEHSPGSGL